MSLVAKSAYTARETWRRVETQVVGRLETDTRHNMRVELIGTLVYGLFHVALLFVPVILRRLGATPEILALYGSQNYIANILSGPVIFLLRPRRALLFLVACWLLSRSLFFGMAFASSVNMFLLITIGYALLEYVPSPIYARIVQTLYPVAHRGKVMATVRLGMALLLVCITPLAGWALDAYGYTMLFPLSSLAGIGAALIFMRWRVDESQLAIQRAQSLGSVWRIVEQDRRYALYLLGVVCIGLGGLVGNSLYPLVQVDQLGLSYTDLGWLSLAQSICWLLSFFYWGRAVDRHGGIRSLQLCALCNAIQPFCYIGAVNGWMLLPAFMSLGIVSAGIDIAFVNSAIALAAPTRVTEYAALQIMVIGIRGLAGLWLGVALHNVGLPLPMIFALGALLNVIAFVILRQVLKSA